MQVAFDTSSFIDFSASPRFMSKEDAFVEDVFCKFNDPEWAFLDTDLSSASTDVNGGISKGFEAKKIEAVKPNSVKFCERVANEIVSLLNNTKFSNSLTSAMYGIMKQIMTLANCQVYNQEFFNLYIINIFDAIWKEKLEKLSKASTNEFDWLAFFSLEALPELLENITNKYDEVTCFMTFETEVGKQIFLSSYKKLLVACNVILVNEVVLRRMLCDQRIREEISNIEDLALIANEYWLDSHYDYSSEQFALNCSGDFAEKLNCARIRFDKLIQSYAQLGIFRVQELETDNFVMLFTFWTQILWV